MRLGLDFPQIFYPRQDKFQNFVRQRVSGTFSSETKTRPSRSLRPTKYKKTFFYFQFCIKVHNLLILNPRAIQHFFNIGEKNLLLRKSIIHFSNKSNKVNSPSVSFALLARGSLFISGKLFV